MIHMTEPRVKLTLKHMSSDGSNPLGFVSSHNPADIWLGLRVDINQFVSTTISFETLGILQNQRKH